MIKIFYFILLFFITPSNLLVGQSFSIHDIPIHENGRVKPLDTFLKNQLLLIYGKRSIKSAALPKELNIKEIDAVDWFFDIVLYPEESSQYNIFNISNPEVVSSLGLDWYPGHLYNINQVLSGLQTQLDYIGTIQQKANEELSQFDEQLLKVYNNVIRFQELSFSLSCLIPTIPINDSTNAKLLSVKMGQKMSYYQLMLKAKELSSLVNILLDKEKITWTSSDYELQYIMGILGEIDQDKFARILKIIPPQDLNQDNIWLSPWSLMDGREISSSQKKLLSLFESYLQFRITNDNINEKSSLANYEKNLSNNFPGLFSINNLKLESWTNKVKLFYKSITFYLISFFLLLISWMIKPILLRKASFISLIIGLLFHFFGILFRIIIMQRPPVSTLYESIIFVSIISVICAALLEYNRKDGVGIFMGSLIGIVLHFVGFGYANDGDTLGMLVAVLNSNFWLATHVTTITTGYGTSLFAGVIGHVYLIQAIKNPSDKKYLKTVYSNMFGATLFALFFTLFGTILGGIWADQSWGRFWGWDPKENGALLIVMWQIMMLHLRITGLVKPLGFALGMILNNIVVILAWFGVNLLSVGLHSYGFASGIAVNISLFIAFELITGLGTYYWAKKRLL